MVAAPPEWEEPCDPRRRGARRGKVSAAVTGGETRAESVRLGAGRGARGRCGGARPRRRPAAPARRGDRARARAARRGLGRRGAGAAVADTVKRVEGERSSRRCRAVSWSPCRRRRRSSRPCFARRSAGDVSGAARLRLARRGARRPREGRRGRPAAAEGDRRGRPGARRVLARASLLVDYHMHLRGPDGGARRYSADRAEEYVAQARGAGVDEIGFSDHVYYFRQTRELWEIPWMAERCGDDLDEYVDAVVEAKRRGLPVKLGLEVDYFPGTSASSPSCSTRTRGTTCSARCTSSTGSRSTSSRVSPTSFRPGRRGGATSSGCGTRRAAACSTSLAHPDLVKIFGVRAPTRRRTTCTSRPQTRSRRPASASRSRPPGCTSRSASSIPTARCSSVPRARRADHARLGRAPARGCRP